MIFVKKHAAEQGTILAMCDEELIGKVLREGKMFLDLDKYADFYRGSLVSEEDALGSVEKDEICSANAVGERSVAVLMKKGVIKSGDIKRVKKVPLVQIFKVDF